MNRQQVYEKYMRFASIFISENILNFELENVSSIMKKIRCFMEEEIQADPSQIPNDLEEHILMYLQGYNFDYCDKYKYDRYYSLRDDGRDGDLVTTMSLLMYPKLTDIVHDALSRAVEDKECGVISKEKKCGIDFSERDEFLRKCQEKRNCFRTNGNWVIPSTKEHFEYLMAGNDVMNVVTRLSRTKKDVYSTRVKLAQNPHFDNNYTIHVQHTSSGRFLYFLDEYKLVLNNMEEEKNKRMGKSDRSCYELYWIITNMCPMSRGSAGTAKVVLNAALRYLGFEMVKEKEPYQRQADWVAMFSPDFEDFYEKKEQLFKV